MPFSVIRRASAGGGGGGGSSASHVVVAAAESNAVYTDSLEFPGDEQLCPVVTLTGLLVGDVIDVEGSFFFDGPADLTVEYFARSTNITIGQEEVSPYFRALLAAFAPSTGEPSDGTAAPYLWRFPVTLAGDFQIATRYRYLASDGTAPTGPFVRSPNSRLYARAIRAPYPPYGT